MVKQEKVRKWKRRLKGTLVGVITTFTLAAALNISTPIVRAADSSATDMPNTMTTNDPKAVMGSDYIFFAQFKKGITKAVPFASEKYPSSKVYAKNGVYWAFDKGSTKESALKGNIGMTYQNIGDFKGKQVDLKLTFMDWKTLVNKNDSIVVRNDKIGVNMAGLSYVTTNFKYIEHGTGKEIKVSGYATIRDIDARQGVTIENAMVDKYYVKDDTRLSYKKDGNNFMVFNDDPTDYDSADLRNMITYTYSSANFNIKFAKVDDDRYKPDDILAAPSSKDYKGSFFDFTSKKVVRTEPVPPTKTVSDIDEKDVKHNTIPSLADSFTYRINNWVPDEIKDYYYDNFDMKDQIDKSLDIAKVKVMQNDGTTTSAFNNDVTKQFDITTKENHVIAKAKKAFIGTAGFYGKNYTLQIDVKAKPNVDFSGYIDKNGNIIFKNKAVVNIDNKDRNSNEVTTETPPTKSKIAKKVKTKDGKLEDSRSIEVGEVFDYQVDFVLGNDKTMNDVTLKDDLEDVFDLQGVKIFSVDGKDVTKDGNLKIDKKTESFTWKLNNVAAHYNQKYYAVISTKLKDGANLSDYITEDGEIKIPNVAHLLIDKTDIPSKEVDVTPPTIDAAIKKNVIKDKKELEHATVEINGKVDYLLQVQVANNIKLDRLAIQDDLEKVLDLENVKVLNAEKKDITSEGDLKLDQAKESFIWSAKKPTNYTGQKLYVEIHAKLKDGQNLDKYKDGKGNIQIPNIAHLLQNDKDDPSNTVHVTPPNNKKPIPRTGGGSGTGYRLLDFIHQLIA